MDRGNALVGVLAVRDFLEIDPTRHALILLPHENLGKTTPLTGLDREIVDILIYLEKANRLRFVNLPGSEVSSAPRLSIFIGNEVREYYGDANDRPILEGALAGVTHQYSCSAQDSWVGKHQSQMRESPPLLSEAIAKLKAFRFSPGDKRDVASIFHAMVGRKVKVVIEDPWCGVRPQNRKKIADFIGTLERSGILICDLTIVWNPYADDFESPEVQIKDLEKQLSLFNVMATPTFESRNKSSGHFHDRVVRMKTQDDGEDISGRWDITSGIDNLMSFHKECKVFMELV